MDRYFWHFVAWMAGLAMGYLWAWCALNNIRPG